ncbi:hypothetical protein WJX73_007282 [Symbiochloris irregularis]|uniref:PUM-HD domain-containing protein n=1 Tax=Symbiochloris irregularis TaxID=706552 RepID=A0AAW1NMU3_9CHLO
MPIAARVLQEGGVGHLQKLGSRRMLTNFSLWSHGLQPAFQPLSAAPARGSSDNISTSAPSLLQRFKVESNFQPSLEDLQGSIPDVCMDRAGSARLRELLVNASADQVAWHPAWTAQEQLAEKLQGHVLRLSQNKFASFTVRGLIPLLNRSWKWIMQNGDLRHKVQITHILQDQVVQLSMREHGNTIAQGMLTFGSPEQQEALVAKILGEEDNGHFAAHISTMAIDRSGCYVVQRVLEMCQHDQQHRLAEYLRHLTDRIGRAKYAKQLCQQVDAILDGFAAEFTAALLCVCQLNNVHKEWSRILM